MSDAKWTPGPFFVHDFTDLGGTVDVSCDHPASITVASMGDALTGTHAEKVANATLFAAVHDLFAACEMVEEWWLREGKDEVSGGAPGAIFKVRGILARLRGDRRSQTSG